MPILRIPLTWTQDERAASTDKDSRRVNVIDETVNGRPMVTKRSGLQLITTKAGSLGQGLAFFNDVLYGVIDDNLVTCVGSPPSSGANGVAWTFNLSTMPWSPTANPRYQYGCVVLNNTIYVIAGATTGVTDVGDVWSSQDGTNWRQCSGAAPFGTRFGIGATVLNGTIFVMGGTAGGTYFNDVWSSQDGTNWTQLTAAAPWAGRSRMGVLTASNGIFVMGGYDGAGASLHDVWFSADGVTWAEVVTAADWGVRSSPGVVWFGNLMYVIGGLNDGTGIAYNDVWASEDGIHWTELTAAAFASARLGVGCVVYNNLLWAIGGGDLTPTYHSDVYSSPDGVTWTLVTSTPGWDAREEMGCVVFPDSTGYQTIWVFSGLGGSATSYYATINTAIASSVALSPTSANQHYQFASYNTAAQLLIKNQSNLWVYGSGSVTKVTDLGYPSTTVPGIVVLGGFAYVMDPTGLIYNCVLNDPFTWPSLNVLGADYEDDAGVALVKYLNYVLAFGAYTIQFFYDAGLQFGSPLAPYLNANMPVGCADANSIAFVGQTVVWVSQTREGRRQVMMMDGFTPVPISTYFIEQFLTAEVSFKAFACTMKGQQCYIVTLALLNMSWLYSFSTKQWYEIGQADGAGGNTTFNFAGYAYDFSSLQYLMAGDGTPPTEIYSITDTAYNDAGVAFNVYLRTSKYDAGNNRRKFWGRLDVIGDQNPGTPGISYTDDDYQTFSTARTVDMSTQRPALFRMGSSRRRAWVYSQTDSNPMRVEALEQEWEQGQ